ncbi:UNVERIFIED_CONTAM: hypothetical protein RMT77_004888 [Armadillidium vulgare]
MQTFPCGHRVVCRKCFVKTIQVAVSQRLLPLRCVVCRAKILRLRQSRDGPFPSSVSQYSMMPSPSCGSIAHHHVMPASHSLYSFNSGSSGLSGVSNVSSASSESGGDSLNRNLVRTTKVYHQGGGPRPQIIKKVKVTSKSGARSKENFNGELPQIRIDNYEVIPIRLSSPSSRTPRVLLRENKVAPQEITCRLPTIKEYAEFISEREIERDKSSSTRIRCAQKLVNQIDHNNATSKNYNNNNSSSNNNTNNLTSVNNSFNINYTLTRSEDKANDLTSIKKSVSLYLPYSKVPAVTPFPPKKGSSSSASSTVCSNRASILIKQTQKPQEGSQYFSSRVTSSSSIGENLKKKSVTAEGGKAQAGSNAKGASSVGRENNSKKSLSSSSSSSKGRNRRESSSGSSSSSSLKNSPSSSSSISVKSSSSSKSGSSSRSSSSYKSATSTKSSTSSFSTSSTITVKSCRSLIPSFRKEVDIKASKRRDPCQIPIIQETDKKSKLTKSDNNKPKIQKKRFEGKEYQRLR